jgi:hypothetical protein
VQRDFGGGRETATYRKQAKMKLFRWYDTLIVAKDEQDAKSQLRGEYTAAEIKRQPICRQRRSVDLSSDDGETFEPWKPSEVVRYLGRGIVPELR